MTRMMGGKCEVREIIMSGCRVMVRDDDVRLSNHIMGGKETEDDDDDVRMTNERETWEMMSNHNQ